MQQPFSTCSSCPLWEQLGLCDDTRGVHFQLELESVKNRKGNACRGGLDGSCSNLGVISFLSFLLSFFCKSVETCYLFKSWTGKGKGKDICFRIEGRKIDPDWVGKASTENTLEQKIQRFESWTRDWNSRTFTSSDWVFLLFKVFLPSHFSSE